MKKIIHYDPGALREFDQFDLEVQRDFTACMNTLAEEGRLAFPEARKITGDIFEIRVSREGIYRGFYAYLKHPDIIVLHFFQKKTQKIPLQNIKIAINRLHYYE